MFDDVTCTAMSCPLCGATLGWQSKDGDCLMDQLTALQLHEKSDPATFYASCPDCHVWVEVSVRSNKGRTPAQWAQHRRDRERIEARGLSRTQSHKDALCQCGHTWDDHRRGSLTLSCGKYNVIVDGTRQCMCLTFRHRLSDETG